MAKAEGRWYRWALCFAAVFHVLHGISLPVLITWDGCLYVDLADVIFSSRFPQEWDFLRTPLYPIALKAGFWLLGKQALAAIAVSTLAGFCGVWMLGAAVRRAGSADAAAAAVVAATLYPTLVGYEHSTLTEAGTFALLALYVNALLWQPAAAASYKKPLALAGVITLGYYWRPTLLYMAPVLAFIHVVASLKAERGASGAPVLRLGRAVWLRQAVGVALIVVLPYLAAYPWSREQGDRSGRQLVFGLLKHTMIPLDHPVLRECRAAYEQAVRDSMVNGHLDFGGVRVTPLFPLFDTVCSAIGPRTGAFFLQMVWQDPARYCKGVIRSMILFAGFPSCEPENQMFRDLVLSTTETGSKIPAGPPHLQPMIEQHFTQKMGVSAIARILGPLRSVYDWAVIAGCILTTVGLAVGLWRLDTRILTVTAVPFCFCLMHALILQSAERYVFPVYPIVLANLCVLPPWLLKSKGAA